MKHRTRRIARNVAVAIPAAAVLVFAAVRTADSSYPTSPHREGMVERGAYLVTIGGCNDCHTPWKMGEKGPELDMSRMLSGHPETMPMPPAPNPGASPWMVSSAATNTAFAGPWGVSFTANLTPDEATGIGAWNEEIFMNTLRRGRHWGQGRELLPPMPWFNYGKMSDDDLRAVFAYLRSIPAVRNNVPLPVPPGGAQEPKGFWD